MARFASSGLAAAKRPPARLLKAVVEDYLDRRERALASGATADDPGPRGPGESVRHHLEMRAWNRWRSDRADWCHRAGLTWREAERLGLWHLGQRLPWRDAS